jgi:hypothetical protein
MSAGRPPAFPASPLCGHGFFGHTLPMLLRAQPPGRHQLPADFRHDFSIMTFSAASLGCAFSVMAF